MTATTATATGAPASTRTRLLRPGRDDFVDAAFVFALGVLALVGFRTTYSGNQYLLVGIAGLVLGILVAHLANGLRQPIIVVVVMAVAVFFLLGAALALRGQALGGLLPTAASTRELAQVSVHGWKQLLTTLPPVARDGPLLAIPYILGLIGGVGGFAMARRLQSVALPLLAPGALLVAVILLGTSAPAAELLQGAVFATVALAWVTIRGARLRAPLQNTTGRRSRIVTGVVLVVGTLVGAALIGPSLPGGGTERVVLRTYVEPPFDIDAYPSPLVGFRKYTQPANNLYDQTLFTVKGLPKGSYVRIATLDGYDGSVWGATSGTVPTGAGQPADSFQRVGDTIATAAAGRKVTLRVTIAAGYASANDVNAWVPTSGVATSVSFLGSSSSEHADQFVYNRATNQGIVPGRLKAGDVYVVRTIVGTADRADAPAPDPKELPFAGPVYASDNSGFTAAQASKWSADATGVVPKVLAVAKHLVDQGAYSDGGDKKSQYLPGHSIYRLSGNFLNDKQPVGDDEQYAAAFALMANQLGLPARVVLGAEPGAGGVVKGKDVHTWVEVHLADGSWHPIPRTAFMPDVHKTPDVRLPDTAHNSSSAVIPPPNPVRPRSSLDQTLDTSDASSLQSASSGSGWQVPGFIVATVRLAGPPLLVIGVVCAVILLLKDQRRKRRRTLGPPATRVARGWDEVTDAARDLGATVPTGSTRREEAAALTAHPVAALADQADATVFGPHDPDEAAAEAYWRAVDDARHAMVADLNRWRRWRAALSLRSLRPRRSGTAHA